jgi:hypothetical protein
MKARLVIGGAVVVGGAVVLASLPAFSDSSHVTQGAFRPFSAGADLQISGHAQMVRTSDGKTIVTVHLEGLEPGVTYPVHVHAAPCAVGEADGHYHFDAFGPASPPNEIWPGPVTANGGGVANGRTTVGAVAASDAISVVVHRPGPAPNKIACADLT